MSTTTAGIIEAQQPGLGGNIGRVRAEATQYRSSVRTALIILIEDLGSRWDSESALAPAAFYAPAAKIILGPNHVIEGRPAIRKAKETATFAMLFRLNRDEWLIVSHTIGGLPVLPAEPAAEQ